MKKLLLILTLFLTSATASIAQNVTNARFSQEGKQVLISYYLDTPADIDIYLSEDGGRTFGDALQYVSGDVGSNVSAGNNTAVWDVLAERDKMQSNNVVFKISAASGVKRFTVNGVTFDMMPVQGGTFTMGCTSEQGEDCYDNERPAHRVTLSSFYIGKFEVTQALWKAVMGSNPSSSEGDDLPVEKVSWNDCQKFIRKLNAKTGKTFRLPTEAEWEYAARGGNKSNDYKYSGSNRIGNILRVNPCSIVNSVSIRVPS
jgi:formylglycine-generating enzyme required for sulfatase activity